MAKSSQSGNLSVLDPAVLAAHDSDALTTRILDDVAMVLLEDASLDQFVDPADRARVRRRRVISAALGAVRQHLNDLAAASASFDVTGGRALEPTSELFAAVNDLTHDFEAIENGRPAELILKPIGREMLEAVSGIKSSRKLLLIWLAVLMTYDRSRDKVYAKNLNAIKAEATKALGQMPNSITTQLSQIRPAIKGQTVSKRFSEEEVAYCRGLIETAKNLCTENGSEKTPFQLLFPGALARSAARLPRQLSAERAKG
jgi:hypothetical protein